MTAVHSPLPALAHTASFSPDSRVWVYTTSRPLTGEEAATAQKHLEAFCQQWTAHNQALQATAEVFGNNFILLMVDESRAGASGCSIDKSVHFLEELGEHLGVDFFERMRFAWVNDAGNLEFSDRSSFSALLSEGKITKDTLVADTLIQTKKDLNSRWLVPFVNSWHKRLF